MTKTDLIMIYLYNKSSQSDYELEQLRHNLRYRSVDEEDALEFIIQKTKTETINEILSEVYRIIGGFR